MTGAGSTGLGPAELAGRLREAADRLMAGWTGTAGTGPSALPGFPLPAATLSARQMQAVLDDLATRRAQVQALRSQLQVFDEQLGALETSLAPMLAWSRAWADLESAAADALRPGLRPGEGRGGP